MKYEIKPSLKQEEIIQAEILNSGLNYILKTVTMMYIDLNIFVQIFITVHTYFDDIDSET